MAPNPGYGAILTYNLKSAVPAEEKKADKDMASDADAKSAAKDATTKEGKAKISIYDKDNKLVREMDGPGAAGLNRTHWDLRSKAPSEPTPEQQEAMDAGYYEGPRGPRVDPGEYTVKVAAAGKRRSRRWLWRMIRG